MITNGNDFYTEIYKNNLKKRNENDGMSRITSCSLASSRACKFNVHCIKIFYFRTQKTLQNAKQTSLIIAVMFIVVAMVPVTC